MTARQLRAFYRAAVCRQAEAKADLIMAFAIGRLGGRHIASAVRKLRSVR